MVEDVGAVGQESRRRPGGRRRPWGGCFRARWARPRRKWASGSSGVSSSAWSSWTRAWSGWLRASWIVATRSRAGAIDGVGLEGAEVGGEGLVGAAERLQRLPLRQVGRRRVGGRSRSPRRGASARPRPGRRPVMTSPRPIMASTYSGSRIRARRYAASASTGCPVACRTRADALMCLGGPGEFGDEAVERRQGGGPVLAVDGRLGLLAELLAAGELLGRRAVGPGRGGGAAGHQQGEAPGDDGPLPHDPPPWGDVVPLRPGRRKCPRNDPGWSGVAPYARPAHRSTPINEDPGCQSVGQSVSCQ